VVLSCMSHKGHCQKRRDARLKSKQVWPDSLSFQLIINLLVTYTGCPALRSSSNLLHSKSGIVHQYRIFSQCSSLQFMIAKCSQPELPYKFRALDKGAFSPCSSYGSINISQFSLVALISSIIWPWRYYSTFYCIWTVAKKWQVDIVVTWNLPAHLEVSNMMVV